MRFLVDECTGSRVANWLREEGHQVGAFTLRDYRYCLEIAIIPNAIALPKFFIYVNAIARKRFKSISRWNT